MRLTRAEKREEKLERKKRETLAKEEGQFLVDLGSALDIEMWSKIDVGANVLHRSLDHLNRVRSVSLKDFPRWKLSFEPKKDSENLSMGHLVLIYSGEGARYYVELRKYSDNIARILLKEIETRLLAGAIIEGIKEISSAFNKDFDKELEALSEDSRALVELTIERTKEVVRLKRWSLGVVKSKYIIFPRFERTVLDKSKVEELEKALVSS